MEEIPHCLSIVEDVPGINNKIYIRISPNNMYANHMW